MGPVVLGVLVGVLLAAGVPSPNPEALLPDTPAPAVARPHGVAHCRKASIKCVTGLERRLRRQWRPLDEACDHRAMFSLAYLRITQGPKRAIRHGHIKYPRWMEYVVADFSNHYLQYFDDYAAGREVPESWRLAYDAMTSGDTSAPQDTLLASNAHTQHDLPFIYAAMGTRTRSGASRKADHDAVNAVNDSVFAGLEQYGAEHYDPQFKYFTLLPLGSDRIATLEMIQTWREGAWRNAVRLLNAKSQAEYDQVVASIDATANATARMILAGTQPGYRATRDAYCDAA